MDVQKAYRVLQKVTERGFDSAAVRVGGLAFVVKTVTPHEIEMVRHHACGDVNLFRLYRMAYATFMVDGIPVLENRSKNIQDLVASFKSMPEATFEVIEDLAFKLQERYKRSCKLVEGFSHSPSARLLWKERKDLPLVSPLVTGIPGTETLGLAESTEVWSLLNRNKDREEESESQLNHAIFIASSSNPRGAQKVSSGLQKEREMASNHRDMLVKYGSEANKAILEKEELGKEDKWSADLTTARDVIEELERQMGGVQDRHDLFIEAYRVKVKREYLEKQELEKARLEEIRKNRGEDPHTGSFEVSHEEMSRILSGDIKSHELAMSKAEAARPNRDGSVSTVGKRVLGARKRGVR